MFQTAEHAAHIARPVVAALSGFDAVVGIVCFGSYALGTADAASDVDLYVVCEPTILPERSRRSAFEQVTRVSEVHVPYATPGWDNAWAPQGDRLKVENVAFDLSYQTQSWITHVMRGVLTEGALSLPEMTFRPYTLCGLFADAVPLYDPRGLVQKLKAQLTPYPFVLKRRLIEKAMPVMKDGLTEL
jgi:predicted nucleotidyltransferase